MVLVSIPMTDPNYFIISLAITSQIVIKTSQVPNSVNVLLKHRMYHTKKILTKILKQLLNSHDVVSTNNSQLFLSWK